MDYTVSEVIKFVEENDVKFIRLAFCDLYGRQKNISIMPGELSRAFERGIPFDASAVTGFTDAEQSDLLLFPDPATLAVLPWRPQHGRVVRFFCNLKHPDGSQFAGDGRYILRVAAQKARKMGYDCKFGAACVFYLFELDDKGNPTHIPQDFAGYCDIAPLDKGENVRREICLTLEQMGITPESSHHEQGNGQNEIDFRYGDAQTVADQLITFKSVVKTVAARNGLYASFLPKPVMEQHGSALHINISLFQNGKNIFKSNRDGHCPEAESFLSGVLGRVAEITAFLNPLVNSYARLGRMGAPKYIAWSTNNRSQLIRIPAVSGEQMRMEVRSPDASCNPYLAFALLIYAGLEGIENKKALPASADFNAYEASPQQTRGIPTLPEDLGAALALAERSEFVAKHLPERTVQHFLESKRREWSSFVHAQDQAAEQAVYFATV